MPNQRTLIDLRDLDEVKKRRPILIAHRGGVVSADSPENSLAAIRGAAADGYDLVELDVVIARDDEPVLFHGRGGGGTLAGTSASDSLIHTWTSGELMEVVYDGSDQRIASLDEALELCTSLGLGAMFDFKPGPGGQLSRNGVKRTAALIQTHGLEFSSMTITPYPPTREILPEGVLFPVENPWLDQRTAGDQVPGIWFDLPTSMPEDKIHRVQEAGVLVIPAINTFRYRDDLDQRKARSDIRRLMSAGVNGFQIDSVYRDAFRGSAR